MRGGWSLSLVTQLRLTDSNWRPRQPPATADPSNITLYHSWARHCSTILYITQRGLLSLLYQFVSLLALPLCHKNTKRPASVNCLSSVVASLLAEWNRMNVDNHSISMVWRSSFDIMTNCDYLNSRIVWPNKRVLNSASYMKFQKEMAQKFLVF